MPYIDSVNVGGSDYDIHAKQFSNPKAIDGVGFDGSSAIIHYGVCTTDSSTIIKDVSISDFTLAAGARVSVLFNNADTSGTPMLNVSSTGGKTIMLDGSTSAGAAAWNAGELCTFIYDGTYWRMDHGGLLAKMDATEKATEESYPYSTISNAPAATFTDGANAIPVKELSVQIVAYQAGSGDPSPENIRPISGRDAVTINNNLAQLIADAQPVDSNSYKAEVSNGKIVVTYKTSGQRDWYVTSSMADGLIAPIVFPVDTPVYCNTEYTSTLNYRSLTFAFRDANNDAATAVRIPNGAVGIVPAGYHLQSISNNRTVSSAAGDVVTIDSITIGNPAVSVSLGQTVYGGIVNPLEGELTITHAQIASYNGETLPGEWISDRDVYAPGTTPTTGAQVVYALDPANYVTVQINPVTISTIVGGNNIWADAGNISVTYRADTTLFVEKEITAFSTSIAPTENGDTASQSYDQGKYFYRNNQFCKALTAIASGASFTLGTNYSVTTLAAELFAALNS